MNKIEQIIAIAKTMDTNDIKKTEQLLFKMRWNREQTEMSHLESLISEE